MTPFRSKKEQRAAFAKKDKSKPKPRRASLSKKLPRLSAGDLEVRAQIEHDSWILNALRRLDYQAYERLTSSYPRARTDLFNAVEEGWSPDEYEDTEALILDAEKALLEHAHSRPERQRNHIIQDLNRRDATLEQRKRVLRLPPARLLKELESTERAVRWTNPDFRDERRHAVLMRNLTRREAERRGLVPPRESKETKA